MSVKCMHSRLSSVGNQVLVRQLAELYQLNVGLNTEFSADVESTLLGTRLVESDVGYQPTRHKSERTPRRDGDA